MQKNQFFIYLCNAVVTRLQISDLSCQMHVAPILQEHPNYYLTLNTSLSTYHYKHLLLNTYS